MPETPPADIVIYHNPACGTSRNTLAMIRNAGIEPHVVEYLKTPPTRPLLESLIARAGITARDLLRATVQPAADGRLTVVEADALAFDPRPMIGDGPARIVANLPYNVGTALLTGWLEGESWPPWWDSLTLMFQREVAERIVATPEERADYGRLGVLCGWRTDAHILFDVAPSAFVPPPKVTSSIVRLVPRAAPLPCRAATLEVLTRAAFGQRRKMLRQSLKGVTPEPARLLDAAGIESALIDETYSRTLQVADPDAWWTRAMLGGAEPVMDMADQFWGDRYGVLRDPFGHTWSIGGPTEA